LIIIDHDDGSYRYGPLERWKAAPITPKFHYSIERSRLGSAFDYRSLDCINIKLALQFGVVYQTLVRGGANRHVAARTTSPSG
jgi:hypothetical protein